MTVLRVRWWRRTRVWLAAALAVSLTTVAGAPAGSDADGPSFPSIEDHFKYGSVGAEERNGLPYWIWRVLPDVFEDKLPDRPGRGYERLGFLDGDAPHGRPIGTSFRPGTVDLVGLNCATCHVGTYRERPDGPRHVVLGMPANQMDLQAYANFLTTCARDPRFEPDTLIAAIRKVKPDFGFFRAVLYRLFVVGRARDGILQRARENEWFALRPPFGPGRVDTFTPYRVLRSLPVDAVVGTVDLPSLWNQRERRGMWLHWDGNNDSVEERNKSAAIGAGASPDSLDLASMARVEAWVWDLRPPRLPAEHVDATRLDEGRRAYDEHCASCHAIGGPRTGQVTPVAEVGTDRERLDSFSPDLAAEMNRIGEGHPWRFRRFRKTDGYANAPLDGLWLRAPYLHNGSVPTLRALLFPEERPAVFRRAYDVYDFTNVGFVSSGPEAEREGVPFDTRLRGNGNGGHLYGAQLPPDVRVSLLEYLKTL